MPEERIVQSPVPLEISPLTETDLRQAGAVKLQHQRICELISENQELEVLLQTERRKYDGLLASWHKADTRQQVLARDVRTISNRQAVMRLIEIGMAGVFGALFDAARLENWPIVLTLFLVLVLLAAGVFLAGRSPGGKED